MKGVVSRERRVVLALAAITLALPPSLVAQRGGHAGGNIGMRRGGNIGMRPIPSAPIARPRPEMPAIWEPNRGGVVPYVRNGQWYGHPPRNDVRYQLARPFQNGQFSVFGPTHQYNVLRTDVGARRVWFNGGYGFEIAPMDWGYAAPWCWECDNFVVYPDPDHPGWYLIYDVTTGEYVHAVYLGT